MANINTPNIELIANNSDWKVFRTTCACLSEDHTLQVEIEYNKKDQDINLNLIANTSLNDHCFFNDKKIVKFWKRIKVAFKVIFNKSVNFNFEFIFRGMGHIKDFSDVLYILSKEVRSEYREVQDLRQQVNKYKGRLSKYEKVN